MFLQLIDLKQSTLLHIISQKTTHSENKFKLLSGHFVLHSNLWIRRKHLFSFFYIEQQVQLYDLQNTSFARPYIKKLKNKFDDSESLSVNEHPMPCRLATKERKKKKDSKVKNYSNKKKRQTIKKNRSVTIARKRRQNKADT